MFCIQKRKRKTCIFSHTKTSEKSKGFFLTSPSLPAWNLVFPLAESEVAVLQETWDYSRLSFPVLISDYLQWPSLFIFVSNYLTTLNQAGNREETASLLSYYNTTLWPTVLKAASGFNLPIFQQPKSTPLMKQEAAPEGFCLLLGWAELAQTMPFNRTLSSLELFSLSRITYMTHFLLQENRVFQIPAQTDTSCDHRCCCGEKGAVCWASAQHCIVFLPKDTVYRTSQSRLGTGFGPATGTCLPTSLVIPGHDRLGS